MQSIRSLVRGFLMPQSMPTNIIPVAGIKVFPPPKPKAEVEYPERRRLRLMEKVPQYPSTVRPFPMQKRLRYMRGPEQIHNTLLYKQYGIIALTGGRLEHGHFEMIRLTFIRRMAKANVKDVFAIWRVDAPWQAVSKKSQGQRMGGGKGGIHHYVTPVKSGRVIVEIGGDCEFYEVQKVLQSIANQLPFKALAVSHTMLEERAAEEKKLEEENQHHWTWKYIIQNNMMGCHKWISYMDKLYYNKHL